MEILTLWPLSQGEIERARGNFVDAIFSGLPSVPEARTDAVGRALRGGFPEAFRRKRDDRRREWYAAYVTTILQRDVRDLANIEGLTDLPRLLALVAARAGTLQNFAEWSQGSHIPPSTLKRYVALLETTFLIHFLRPWSGNLSQRLVKSPKVYFTDTGLLAHLSGLTPERLAADPYLRGPLLENFVVAELLKQLDWSRARPRMYFLRTQTGVEVDVVLEDAAGDLVGIEVKASASVGGGDFRGLRALAEAAGRKFRCGVVLYTGAQTVPFAPNLHALPMSALWSSAGASRRAAAQT